VTIGLSGRRAATAAVAVASLGAVVPAAFGGDAAEPNAQCGMLACRVERVPARWQLADVGFDLRLLKIAYESNGCRRGRPQATVAETAAGIGIAVEQEEVVAVEGADRSVYCAADVSYRFLYVHLKRRIAGRPFQGGPRIEGHDLLYSRTETVGGRTSPLAPRVLDLSRPYAKTVLRLQGFKTRFIGRRSGPTLFQSPLPGRRAPRDTVRLTVGRVAFHARWRRACLRRAGIPSRVRRPQPGDEDAPDLELLLTHPNAWAFAAFYADPARGRENLPMIRRNARRFNGVIEVRRRVTIIWVRRPDGALRSRAWRCLAMPRVSSRRSVRD
jgi:hypothetical protein